MTACLEEVCQLCHGNKVGNVRSPGGGRAPVEAKVTLGQDRIDTVLTNDLLR